MSETDPWNIAREEFKKRRMRKKPFKAKETKDLK